MPPAHLLRLFPPLAAFLFLTAVLRANPVELHISPSGKPGAIGTAQDPLPTIMDALTVMRSLPSGKKVEGVTILLSGGLHSIPDGVVLDASCSGTPNGPLIITAETGSIPVLTAGRAITPDLMEPVKDSIMMERLDPAARSHIRQIDLAKLGIPPITAFRQVFRGDWRPLQVVFGTNALPISRWPKGEHGFTTMKSVTDNGDATHGGTFVYREDRPTRWMQALEDNQLWLRGFWRVPWVINGAQVKAIDTNACSITFMRDVGGGIGSKYNKTKDALGKVIRPGNGNEPWCALNLPEEITEPGDWAVDFKRQTLFLWPPDGVNSSAPILLAANQKPLLFLENASHVTVKGITFLGCVADAVQVKGGENNLIAGCDVSHVAHTGISVIGGKHHRVVSNNVRETGNSGLLISGGVKASLEHAGHEILNNDVSRAANDCVEPAIHVGLGEDSQFQENAVGIRVAHNRIHDTANAGIRFGGSDNVFEFNEIYRVGLNSADLGGIYGYCGFTGFGNVIRNNFVHHSMNANAIYLDDGTSGVTVLGNMAYKCGRGIFMGGGHYNRILNNIIIECTRGMKLDDRGIGQKYTLGDTPYGRDVASVSPDHSPWKERHPGLADLVIGGDTTAPKADEVIGNVAINCTNAFEFPAPKNATGIVQSGNSTEGSLSDFVDVDNFDFTLRRGSALANLIPGINPIPFGEIGLQVDEYRKTIPSREMKVLREGDTWKSFPAMMLPTKGF
jgi:parallel beta-helix repeat protein